MSHPPTLSRRKFMQIAALGVGSLTIVGGCRSQRAPRMRFFAEDEVRALEAIADQMIPPDEWPGGRESGVVTFIDKQLVGPYRRFQSDYRTGLYAVTQDCAQRYGKKFEALSWDQQTSYLKEMESGSLNEGPWSGGFGRRFFQLLRSHSLQGYYGSPRHGGNKNFTSYKMLGLDYPQLVGRNRHSS